MRKNQVKLMVAGMLVLALMTGCGSNDNDNDMNESSNSMISMDTEDIGYNSGEQESQTNIEDKQESQMNIEDEQTEENSQSQPQSQSQSQSQDTGATENIEEELAAYRAEREKGISSIGNYTLMQYPNEENYSYDVGDISYVSRFDSKELNEAFKVAGAYVKDTLNLENGAWICIDPRMTAIYEDDDKGVANGYDADNIFLCEYNDNGNWQYLILVREGKGSDWEVLYHGSSYKTE